MSKIVPYKSKKKKHLSTLTSFVIITLIILGSTALAQESKTVPSTKDQQEDKKNNTALKQNIEPTVQYKADIKHYLPTDELKPLLVGSDDYLTLIKKYTSAKSHGVVILLPDWQQSATNPKAINYLRSVLPEKGWNTITIQPNHKPENFPSRAITVEAQKKENQLTLQSYKKKLMNLLNAVMNTTKDYPGQVIMISQGNNAALLVDLYSQENIKQPNALILLSSYRQSNPALINIANENYAQQIAATKLPILDLYLKFDNSLSSSTAKLRKTLSKQNLKDNYRQRQLNNTLTGYYPNEELLSQINRWLKTIN